MLSIVYRLRWRGCCRALHPPPKKAAALGCPGCRPAHMAVESAAGDKLEGAQDRQSVELFEQSWRIYTKIVECLARRGAA